VLAGAVLRCPVLSSRQSIDWKAKTDGLLQPVAMVKNAAARHF